MAPLSGQDYAVWAGTVIAIFVVILVAGNFGNLYRPVSLQTVQINSLYRFVYIAGSGVGAIFIGSLIWMIIKFREKSEAKKT